jgi:hypothetical protein
MTTIQRTETPTATRIECRVESTDGQTGVFAVTVGREPNSIKQIAPLQWSSRVHGPIAKGSFSAFGDNGWTGQMIALNSRQWRALVTTRQVERFLAAMLWGGQPMRITKRAIELENWQRESAGMFNLN